MVFSYAGTGRIPQMTSVMSLGLISYSYNPSIREPFLYLDFGSIAINYWVIENHADAVIEDYKDVQLLNLTEDSSVNSSLDYGLLSQVEAVSTEDWGLITVSSDITTFGFAHFTSLATWSVIRAWEGTGQIFEYGGSIYRLNAPWIGSGTLRVSGNTITNYVPNVTTKGLLPLRGDTKISFAPNWIAYGSVSLQNTSQSSIGRVYYGYENISIVSEASIIASLRHIGSGSLFAINNAVPTVSFNYVGSGSLFTLESAEETVTWDYNPDSIVYFEYEDYGLVSEPVIDSLVIADIANDTIQQYADVAILDMVYPGSSSGDFIDHGPLLINDQDPPETLQIDWGYIWETYTKYPMGLGRISGEGTYSYAPNWNSTGTISIFGTGRGRTNPIWKAFVQISVYGAAKPNFSLLHVGSGTLFGLSNGDVSRSYDYQGTGNLYAISGAADSVGFNPPDITTDIKIFGDGGYRFAPNWISEGNITVDVEHVVRSAFSEVGSGTLFNFDSKVERRTYSYNPSSDARFVYFDYGNVSDPVIDSIVIQDIADQTIEDYADTRIIDLVYNTSSGDYFDYGLVADYTPTVTDDYEFIWQTVGRFAMGDLKISGVARTTFSLGHFTSGDIAIFGTGRGRTNPYWNAFVEIPVRGEAVYKTTSFNIGSGNLFAIVSTEQSRSYAYTGIGNLYAVSGAAESVGSNPPDITTDIKISGDGAYRFAPNWNGEGIVSIDVEHVVRSAFSEVGSGTLFNFDSKVERRTYSYNPLSDVRFAYLDYGNVLDAVIDSIVIQDIANDTIQQYADVKIVDLVYGTTSGDYFDYGPVSDYNPSITDDYEFIWQTAGRFAMGDLKISGASKTNFSLGHASTGDIKVSGTGRGRTNPIWFAFIDVIISGIAEEKSVKIFTGSGDLYSIVSTEDSRSYAYEGLGNLYAISGAAEAVGANPPDITTTINIAGEASYRFAPNWNGEGIVTIDVDHVVRAVFSEVGSGILYNFDSLVERRTYSYNLSSIDYLEHRDYGLVSEPAIDSIVIQDIADDTIQQYANTKIIDLTYSGSGGNYFDYGYLQQPLEAGLRGVENPPTITDDYQYILDSASIYPFGRLRLGLAGFDTKTVFSLLHIGNLDGTQIKITGESFSIRPNVFTGSGALFVTEGQGITERVSFAETKEGLFRFAGSAGEAYIPNWNSFGTISISGNGQFAVAAAAVKEGYINIFGDLTESFTTSYVGSGNLYAISGAAEAVGFNPPDITTDIIITGASTQRTTVAHVGFGSLFGFSGAVESYSIAEDKRILLDIVGEASYRFAPNWNGSGDLFALNGAAESFTASPDDLQVLFSIFGRSTQRASFAEVATGTIHISGTTEPEILTFAEQPEVIVSIFGQVSERYVPNWNGSGSLYAMSGAAESVSVNPPDITTDLKISGAAKESFSFGNFSGDSSLYIYGEIPKPPTLVFAESGFGTIQLSGIANVINIDVYLAEGTIFSRGIVSESKTVKIPAFKDGIFTIRGAATESVSVNPPDITTRIAIFGQSETPILTFAEQPVVRILTSGSAVERNTESYLGSGIIFSNGIAGESITRKLPAFTADISISGAVTESAVYREIFFGSLFAFTGSTEPEILTFAEQPEVQISISGQSINKFSASYVGTGFISTLSGAAEAVAFNPPEREILFTISGGFSDIKIVKSEVKSVEISIDVETDFRFIPNWVSEGTIPVTGVSDNSVSKDYIGTGFISTLSGAAEAVTFNPPEREILFSIAGSAIERNTESYVGDGSVFSIGGASESVAVSIASLADIIVTGNSINRIALSYVGSGDLYTINGAAESVTYNPEEQQILFAVSGNAVIRSAVSEVKFVNSNIFNEDVKVYLIRYLIGDGNITIDVTTEHSRTKVYTGFGNLFTVSNAEVKKTFDYQGEASLYLTGNAIEKNTESYVGFGTFSTFNGSAEAVTFNPADQTTDLQISGVAVIRSTAREIGSGNLFGLGGASESRTIVYNNVATFTFVGSSKDSTSKSYIATGDVYVTGNAQEAFVRTPYNGQVDININVERSDRIAKAYVGEASIKATGNAIATRIQRYNAVINTEISGIADIVSASVYVGRGVLFGFGNAQETAPATIWIGQGVVTITGSSVDKKVTVSPQRTYGWIV